MVEVGPLGSKVMKITEQNKIRINTSMKILIKNQNTESIHHSSINKISASMNIIKEGWNKSLACI
jgi:hypothetical protein